MKDEQKTKQHLIAELVEMRQRIAQLEKLETEHKQSEETLREAREYAESIVETVREPLVVLDNNLRVVTANRCFYQTFQVMPQETKGYSIYELGNRQWNIPKLRQLLEEILPKATTFDDFEVKHDFETIGQRTMMLNARQIYRESDNTQMILLAIEDITERKQAEKQLKEYSQHLVRSERLATLGQFSGNISHELRNPLGVIDSSIYYLKTKLKDADEKTLEHLDRIRASVDGATATIDSLLNLTRMREPRLARLDLIAVTADAINTSKVPATVNVIQSFPEQEVLVNADHEQLVMAFKNVITNAIDAMGGVGMLTVTIHRTADGQAEVSFADTGPGIAAENLDKVFQPLFSTKAKGFGFGLSIAKMVIDSHGGTIEAKAEPGKGATIIIRLPLYMEKDKEI
jgi:PAS domain S-box-containing protein